jgi:hypothetical protein
MTKEKMYVDAQGYEVPAKYVSTYDKQRDKIARAIHADWLKEEERLKELKAKTLQRIEQMRMIAAKSAGVKDLGGRRGNLQFRDFSGCITVVLDTQYRTEFDERLELAQMLIMEAVKEIASDANNHDLVEIATRAFSPRKSGHLDMARVRELKNYKVKHRKWKQAIKIIDECEREVGSRQYIRVQERRRAEETPRNILLDMAKIECEQETEVQRG